MEREGGEMTSLIVVGVSWMDDFVILGALEIDSLLVSEPHETHKKTIRIAETIRKSQPRCFNFSIPSTLTPNCCMDLKKLLKELLVLYLRALLCTFDTVKCDYPKGYFPRLFF